MIPTIGLMVAAIGWLIAGYVITRMLFLSGQGQAGGVVRFFAALTIVLAIVVSLALAVLGWALISGEVSSAMESGL